MDFGTECGAKDVEAFLRHLENAAVTNERLLLQAAASIEADESTMNSLLSSLENLESELRRLDICRLSARDKFEQLGNHYGEIDDEITGLESDLPILSEISTLSSDSSAANDAQEVFQKLELLSRKFAFLQNAAERISGVVEEVDDAAQKEKIDEKLVQIAEIKSKQESLEWEVKELENNTDILRKLPNSPLRK